MEYNKAASVPVKVTDYDIEGYDDPILIMYDTKIIAREIKKDGVTCFELERGLNPEEILPGCFRRGKIETHANIVAFFKDRIFLQEPSNLNQMLEDMDMEKFDPWLIAKKKRGTILADSWWLKVKDTDTYETHTLKGLSGIPSVFDVQEEELQEAEEYEESDSVEDLEFEGCDILGDLDEVDISKQSKDTYTPFEFATMIGRSVPTLRRWATAGKLIALVDDEGNEYYSYAQYLEVLNMGETLETHAPKGDVTEGIYAKKKVTLSQVADDIAKAAKEQKKAQKRLRRGGWPF